MSYTYELFHQLIIYIDELPAHSNKRCITQFPAEIKYWYALSVNVGLMVLLLKAKHTFDF